MLSVEEAQTKIITALSSTPLESISITHARGRVLGKAVFSRRVQPPFDASAMDGYAVRSEDVANVPADLTIIGEAPAGGAHDGSLGAGEAVRIFTGGPVPPGADAIVIQENTERNGDMVRVLETVESGRFIRRAGLDFDQGDAGPAIGARLTPNGIALLAGMDIPWVDVHQKPRVGILASGDELVRPGEPAGPNQIVSSNNFGICALVEQFGGVPIDLGIAPDTQTGLKACLDRARNLDLLVTIGGASVGDYDLMHQMLGEAENSVNFYKIAMRPGKPLMFGSVGATPMIGLPGNPVSAMVCGHVFLVPALRRLSGMSNHASEHLKARLGLTVKQNDQRQEYLRARIVKDPDGALQVLPFDRQDSSQLSLLARSDCLVIRPPHAPEAMAGTIVDILPLSF